MLKEPIIRHSYQFLIVPNPEGHSWKVDDDGLFNFEWTDGKIVPQEMIYCIIILLVARWRTIVVIDVYMSYSDEDLF